MLDDAHVIKQRDKSDALGVAAGLSRQAGYGVQLEFADHDHRPLDSVVIAGMGGSALAADIAKTLLASTANTPLMVVKGYELPHFVGKNTLVIVSSHSGNTEETVSCLSEALRRGCQVAVTATGGTLVERAGAEQIMLARFPHDTQPRMAVIYNLRCILAILVEFEVTPKSLLDEMQSAEKWLAHESDAWVKEMPIERNYAKQLALIAVGKTPVFYGGELTAPLAYKWKISWNENAKNVAFWNQYPEFNHNEFLGWTSHPIEKPFVIFDIMSDLELPRVTKRFILSDKLLSGRRPKANQIHLAGDSILKQLLWGAILADFVSIYVAILNNVDPTPVDLIERFKKELN